MSENDEKAPLEKDLDPSTEEKKVEESKEVVEEKYPTERTEKTAPQTEPKSEKSPKKGKSCSGCVIASAVFLIILFIILGLFGFLLYRSSSEKEDLGVEGSIEGFESFIDKTGIETDVDYSDMCFTCDPLTYSGEQDVQIVITEEDASSWIGTVNQGFYGLSGLQMSFTDDGVALSAYVTYNGQNYPIYISGDINRVSEKEVEIVIDQLEVMNFEIPENYQQIAEDWLQEISNTKIQEVDGLTIDKLEIGQGEVLFEGTVPEEITY